MFVDEVRVYLKAGSGGHGALSFRREKYVPRGGPDGGDGGRGGDVICAANPGETTLARFRGSRRYQAENGGNGSGANRHGADGEDVVLEVPAGTVIRREDGSVLRDLQRPGERVLVARGGRGGRGNARFATSRDQAPRIAEKGEPGEEAWFILELRLVADIGFIGMPNAGKSTLLRGLTNARPKVGDYPFTTLDPEIGITERDGHGLVLADLPGLIEGAHAGRGLGHRFLRHASRCRAFVHVVDAAAADPVADLRAVRTEMELYDRELTTRPFLVAANKLDLPEARSGLGTLEAAARQLGARTLAISAASGQGLQDLQAEIFRTAAAVPAQEPLSAELRETVDPTAFRIVPEADGFRVEGVTVERRVAMADLDSARAVMSLQRYLRRKGVEAALRQAGAKAGTTVRIREHEFELSDEEDQS